MSCFSTKIIFTITLCTKQQGGEKYGRSITNCITAHKLKVLTLCCTHPLPMCFPNMVI